MDIVVSTQYSALNQLRNVPGSSKKAAEALKTIKAAAVKAMDVFLKRIVLTSNLRKKCMRTPHS
ncbi:hypothetical protein [Cohnella rhizosphaerae]|uniref:Uncharacterized protein n=1 Tax=Cohnella rhizosphaerae TaxID=1457232 RepID=A0A9X4KZU0_9BACL|nr:hypothetical protein [Cohnella rhizosphaerae]MDG0813905.1 hypothetical protein [Cohnella rhizosphaerae]